MDLRRLSLFVLVCQNNSHAEAAAAAGVSVSTVSTAVRRLEQDLGLVLLRRGPGGLVPSDAGRWLSHEAESILQCADALFVAGEAPQVLAVQSPLRLTFGRLSRTAHSASRQFAAEHPDWRVALRFASAFSPASGPADPDARNGCDLLLGYSQTGGGPDETALFDDRWVAIGNRAEMDPANLAGVTLWLPPLLPELETQIRAYCAARSLPPPESMAEDAAILARLARNGPATVLLTPHSLMAANLERSGVACRDLAPALVSQITARIITADPERRRAASRYLDHLRRQIAAPQTPVRPYAPKLTLAQLRLLHTLLLRRNQTVAARELGLSQPALSAQLRRIETAFGQRLFDRSARGLEPVAFLLGRQQLLRHLLDTVAEVARQARHIAAQDRSEVTLGLSPLVALHPDLAARLAAALGNWRDLLPDAALRLREAPAATLSAEVRRGEIGLALGERIGPRRAPRDLAALGPLVLLESDRPAATPRPLIWPIPEDGIAQAIDASLPTSRGMVALRGVSTALGLHLARQGLGICPLPQRMAEAAIASGDGLTMRIPDPECRIWLCAEVTTERALGEAERLLLDCLRRSFGEDDHAASRR